jgi:hypothetical protein
MLNTYKTPLWLGLTKLFLGGIVIGWSAHSFLGRQHNSIPNVIKVQTGYIAPSQLEVRVADLDKNGELETILQIGDKPYALREVDGKPVLSEYEIPQKKLYK